MKLFILLSIVFGASTINAYVSKGFDAVKVTEKIEKYMTECIVEYGKKAAGRTLNVDETKATENANEIVTQCFFEKAGILKSDGNMNTDAVVSILSMIGMEKEEIDDFLSKCTSVTGYDAKATSYAIFKCVTDGLKL